MINPLKRNLEEKKNEDTYFIQLKEKLLGMYICMYCTIYQTQVHLNEERRHFICKVEYLILSEINCKESKDGTYPFESHLI